ncbi:MAG: hypothetical protein M4D80_24740 [Myxococcota bacterium]|nr:hypothetical protein [Deltaproteobacteria bacterium]MDQ3338387.1 hypothetical protein [Myxococcota bacterium]
MRPNAVTAAVTQVTVVGGQRVKATLVVPPERIEVRVTGSCSKAVALWTEDGLDELDEQSCGSTFTVPPGAYRACVDGDKKCTPIKVLPAPAKQTFAR